MSQKFKYSSLFLICLLASGFILSDKEKKASSAVDQHQPDIAALVSTYLTYYHYQRYGLDDEVSKKVFKAYLKNLDFNRMFFLQSDIDGFSKFQLQLDDFIKAEPANLEPAFHMYEVFKQRVIQRVDLALALLSKDMDFTVPETFSYDRTEAPWAQSMEELDELWRRRIKEDVIRFQLRDKPKDEYLDILTKRYNRLKKNIVESEPADITERFLSSLAETYDPHSSYLRPATKDNFDIQMGHSLEGIGATLTTEGEYTVVVSLVEGGPAHRSEQIHVNDKIIAVAQGDDEPQDVVDMRIDKVVKQIRGPKGSKVRLTIIPNEAADHSITKEVVLIRERVEITTEDAKAEIKELEAENGHLLRVGVIDIPSFYMDTRGKFKGDPNYKSTTRDVRKILKNLKKEKLDGLVIDLRRNGGGSLDEAIQLTGLFIDKGPVVQIRDYRGGVQVEDDPDPRQVYNGPLVVLTSIFSASASEIFSSAIQDYGRGVVVGSKSTHGKGTVQNVVSLEQALERKLRTRFDDDVAGALKLTTHKFYRISGGSTQFKGVEPDVVIPSPFDGMEVTEETLDYALPWDEIDPVKYKNYRMVGSSLDFLKTNSARRVALDPEFRYVREDLEYSRSRKQKNSVSLVLAKRLAEKKELEDLEKNRKEERKLRIPVAKSETDEPPKDDDKETVPVPDFILEETLLIMRDYISHRNQFVAGVTPKKENL